MNKPNNYDQTQAGGDYTPVELGGHHAVIKSVKEQQSSTGKNMIVVALDFAKNDKQPGYFSEQFAKDVRPEKKWPYQAIQYIVAEDKDGQCSRSFKSFINAFEKSNNCEAVWGEKFINQFKNKKVGVVYGEVEEEYNGEVKTRHRIRWFCEDSAVEKAKIPDAKILQNTSPAAAPSDDFINVPEGVDEEIPF